MGNAFINGQTFGGGAKIQTGSYVGTGTYGANNPVVVNFNLQPLLFLCLESDQDTGFAFDNSGYSGSILWISGQTKFYSNNGSGSFNYIPISETGSSLSWYSDRAVGDPAQAQLNSLGRIYIWLVIGT